MHRTYRNFVLVTLAAAATLAAPVSAHAFTTVGGGGRLGMVAPEAGDAGIDIGAHVDLEQAGSRWHLSPNVQYWDTDPVNGFNGSLDALYHFAPDGRTSPYLGAGGGFQIVDRSAGDSETDPAVNLFGGVLIPASSNRMFVEARYTASDFSQASLSFGATFR